MPKKTPDTSGAAEAGVPANAASTRTMIPFRAIPELNMFFNLLSLCVSHASARALAFPTLSSPATRFATGPRMAWRYIKRNMKAAEEGSLSDTLDSEAYGMLRCRETEDHAEAARAFVEKRTPMFNGR